jgi:hypothetical protein
MKKILFFIAICFLVPGILYSQGNLLDNYFDAGSEEGWSYSNEDITGTGSWGATSAYTPFSGSGHLWVPIVYEDFEPASESSDGIAPSLDENYISRNDIANPGELSFYAKYINHETIESVDLKVYYDGDLIGSQTITDSYASYDFSINQNSNDLDKELKILADYTFNEVLSEGEEAPEVDIDYSNGGSFFIDNLTLTEFGTYSYTDHPWFQIISSDGNLGDVTIGDGVDFETIPGFRYIPVTDVVDVTITGDNNNLNACVRIYYEGDPEGNFAFFRSENGNPPWERLWPTSSGSDDNGNYVQVCGVEHMSQWVLGGPDPNAKAPLSNWMFILIFGIIGVVVLIRYKF